MTVNRETGTFNTGTGAVSSTVSVSSLSFTPTFIIFHWNGRTEATNTVGRSDSHTGFGFTGGASLNYSTTDVSIDNVSTTVNTGGARNDTCIFKGDSAGTDGLLSLQSFNADGFTLVVNEVMGASLRVSFIAYGGDEITDVAMGYETNWGAGATGAQSISGLSFQPDVVFFTPWADDVALPDYSTDRGGLGFGAAVSATKEAVISSSSDGGGTTSVTHSYIYNGESHAQSDFSTKSVRRRFEMTSLNSDGFTVNILENATTNWTVMWIAVGGGALWSVDDVNTRTDTNDIVLSGLGFTPAGGIVVSACRAMDTQNLQSDHRAMSFGVFDSATSRASHSILDEDNLTTTEVTTAIEFDAVYANIDASSAIQGLMDVKSMDSDGVTFIMDDADPSSAYAFVVTVGSSASEALEQEGYRWRDDNGSESAASWLDSQDTNISRAKNTPTRLRALVNATGDPASQQYQLEYRKTGDTNWRKVK